MASGRRCQLAKLSGESPLASFAVDFCARLDEYTDRFFVAEGGGAVQRCFAAGAGVPHEATGLDAGFGGPVGIGSVSEQHVHTRLCATRSVVQRAESSGVSPVSGSV